MQTVSLSVAASRAPYVTFELRPIEDRAASMAQGIYVTKDIPFAIVTPSGSKDRYEYEVEPWFKNLEQQVREERFPQEWFNHYKTMFKAWKDNEALPEVGVPIKNWGVVSPSQRQLLIQLGVTTVEALAGGNEELIGRLGMGGRALVQRAKDFLEAKDQNKVTFQIDAMRAELAAHSKRAEALEEQNANLRDLVTQLRSKQSAPTQEFAVAEDGFMKDL